MKMVSHISVCVTVFGLCAFIQDDFPAHSLRNHRPYSKSHAFGEVLGTNAKLGDDRLLPLEDGATTCRDYPEKMPMGENVLSYTG